MEYEQHFERSIRTAPETNAPQNPRLSGQRHIGSHLIYFRPKAHLNEEIPELENVHVMNKNILAAEDVSSAKRLLSTKKLQIGIAACHFLNDRVIEELKEIFTFDENILWILLLPKQFVDDSRIASLISLYCYDYHTYPVQIERLGIILGHALGMVKLRNKNTVKKRPKEQENLVGNSTIFQKTLHKCTRAAQVEAPVLLIGESGTGKELLAKHIHNHSNRSNGPFVAVNCAALPASLIQSELFGHEKGSFTGADTRRIGRLEAANDSTIFLDEIGDLPLEMQVILLRFLETKTIERLGSTKTIPANARVIAATHVNLEQAVADGKFREDLYYRLNVLPLKVPNLQTRGSSDIKLLAEYYLDRYTKDNELKKKKFSASTLSVMIQHNWPGNIRELINRVSNAAIMSDKMIINPLDIDLERRDCERPLLSLEEAKRKAEKSAILTALSHTNSNSNISQAAIILDVSRSSLYRLIDKHHIKIE